LLCIKYGLAKVVTWRPGRPPAASSQKAPRLGEAASLRVALDQGPVPGTHDPHATRSRSAMKHAVVEQFAPLAVANNNV
jgi:hypothetical protein